MTPLSPTSLDLTQDNIEQLKALFPNVFTEGKIDFDALKAELGEHLEVEGERYQFSWNGKAQAKRIATTPSMGTLRPAVDESVNWDTTENLYIEGDNLEVLKLLQKAYFGKVKMIYIDPPYNTGKDFVYKDDFKDNLSNYKRLTKQVDDEGNPLTTNSDSSGRYHSNWLNMMYPRLKLARNLLRDDGVIFISIDDNEVHNLRKLCDEIFGEGNFVGNAGRITKKSNNKGDFWAPNFDYLLTYVKSIESAQPFFGGANLSAYNLVETEGDRVGEKYQLVRLYMSTIQNRNPEQRFWIECPDGSKVIPPGKTFPPVRPELGDGIWRWSREKFENERDKIVIKEVRSSNLVTEDGSPAKWNVFTKTYLQDVIDNASAKPNNFIEGHINQVGSHEINSLGIPFDYSKPSTLIRFLTEISKTDKNDIILDFFSGSATTAHAVMQLNADDGGNRKFILVQIPEATPEGSEARKAGYATIAEIGKERIRRAGKKIQETLTTSSTNTELDFGSEKPSVDCGFKVFKLDTSNIKAWNPTPETLQDDLLNAVDNILVGRTDEDLLYEVLIKYGLPLTLPVEKVQLGQQTGFSVGMGSLIACFAQGITLDTVQAIANLSTPENPVLRVVFRDSSFADDNVKTNAVQRLKQAGIEDVVSV
jgi:adenine-specific DNA-methyltransferase